MRNVPGSAHGTGFPNAHLWILGWAPSSDYANYPNYVGNASQIRGMVPRLIIFLFAQGYTT